MKSPPTLGLLNSLALILLAVIFVGCSESSSKVNSPVKTGRVVAMDAILRDKAGQTVMQASIKLPWPPPPPGQPFSGAWSLQQLSPAFPVKGWTPAHFNLGGSVQTDGSVYIDLSYPIMDNNDVLLGRPDHGEIVGEWKYLSFAGGNVMGTFILKPATP